MRNLQKEIIKVLEVKHVIDSKEEIRKRVDFLKQYCQQAKANGFVLGISGGQDSTLAGKLAQMAVNELKAEGYEARFTAVRLPYQVQKDETDAQKSLQFIQPDEIITYNISQPVESFKITYDSSAGKPLADFHKGNVKARTRMMVQYAVAGEKNLLVIGTDHASEAVTGFFTKFGDGAADILPLSGLNKRQGKALLKELGADETLYLKKPTADLLDEKPQQEDETELGITYEVLDDYLEGKEIVEELAEKIEHRYIITKHKREQPVKPSDTWWLSNAE